MISLTLSEAVDCSEKPMACMQPPSHASTGAELARTWKDVPHLGIEAADEFAADIAEARSNLQAAAK